MFAIFRSVFLVSLIAFSGVASSSTPLYSKNLSPITGLLGIPSQRTAAILQDDQFQLDWHTQLASHFVSRSSESESLLLDGETLRSTLELRYGINDKWEFAVEVPFVSHQDGSLDGFINDWHDFWGFSDGGRSRVAEDLFAYRYSGSQSQFFLSEEGSGLGDISLAFSRSLVRKPEQSASISIGYKLPTGEDNEFLGSGSGDAFLALRYSRNTLWKRPISLHSQIGYLRAGTAVAIDAIQERNIWFAGFGLDWRAFNKFSVLGQLDYNNAPSKSQIDALGDNALSLTLGGRWYFAPDWAIDLSLIEDLNVEASPDVVFQMSLRFKIN